MNGFFFSHLIEISFWFPFQKSVFLLCNGVTIACKDKTFTYVVSKEKDGSTSKESNNQFSRTR